MDGRTSDWAPYASALVARWLREVPEVTHRRLTGTLVSADLSGFTAMSERLAVLGREGSERLTDVVNGCFETLISIAAVEGGDVLKFGGDALLIWFEGDVSAIHAGRAMVRMQRAIGRPRFASLGLKMSVGGHFGDFDMFLVGQPDWRELVLAGVPVTRTVDLEAAANAGEILVSAELARRLPTGWCGPIRSGQALVTIGDVPRPRPTPAPPVSETSEAVVPPDLRDDLDAISSLGGEHRLTTVVFLEVLGTDDSLLQVGPAEFVTRLDDLVRAAQRLQDNYGVQFLYTDVIANGIKLIATAGAPRSTVNDDEAALRFAVDYVRGDPLRHLKAGVNRGRVFAGFLGSERRKAYTVMGDSVNLAARLMGHAQPGQVIASLDVIDGSRAEVRATGLPPFLVKGKTEPIRAAVVEEVGADRSAEPELGMLPLVGREAELAIFDGWLADVVVRRGHAVEVVGAAGVGKSRLLAEVAADDRLFTRMSVLCQPYAKRTAYAAAKVVLRRALGIRFSATATEAGQALTRLVGAVKPDLVPFVPLIAPVLDATVPTTPETEAIADEFILARTHEAVVDLLTVTLLTPTLIQVEDAYYLDTASAELFAAIARVIENRPWLLVSANQPDAKAVLPEGSDRLELEPLGPEAALALAAAAGVNPSGTDGDLLAKRADGNPLFILRLSEAVPSGTAAEDLPESVERVIAERLDRLHPSDRTLLRYASVVGPRFDIELLDAVVRRRGQIAADAATWRRLTDLVEFESETIGRFKHLLYRDVAYEALPFRHRTNLHRQVGELLEASSQAADVALLAEHFFRAGDKERTWRYSVAAGDQAWKSMAVAEAAAAYERALGVRRYVDGLLPREGSRVAEALGDALERVGQFREADSRYQLAHRLVPNNRDAQLRMLRKRGVLRERAGKYSAALRWYERGRVAASGDSHSYAQLLVASAGVLYRLGHTADQVEMAYAAVERAQMCADIETEAHAWQLIQLARTQAGDVDDLSPGERALGLFTRTENVLFQGKVHNNLGIAHYFGGRWKKAAEHYRLGADRFGAAGDVVEAAAVRNNLGELLSDQGLIREALSLFRSAKDTFEIVDYPLGAAVVRSNIARARSRSGDAQGAVADLRSSVEEFTALGLETFRSEALIRLAEGLLLAAETERVTEVLTLADHAVEAGASFPGSDAAVQRLFSWTHRQRAEVDQAIDRAHAALDLAESNGARFECVLALTQLAELTADPAVVARAAAEREALGIVSLPVLPIPL